MISLGDWLEIIAIVIAVPGAILALRILRDESDKQQEFSEHQDGRKSHNIRCGDSAMIDTKPTINRCVADVRKNAARKPYYNEDLRLFQASMRKKSIESTVHTLQYVEYILIGIIIAFICYVSFSWISYGVWPSFNFLLMS